MTPARVTARDCFRAGFCVSGMKEWLAERGVDYRAFVRDGLPGAEVEAFGDAMSDLALAQARTRAGGWSDGRRRKGGGKVQIVKYYMTVHYALCHGVVDRLRRIVIKEKDAWTGGQVGAGAIHLRDGEMFGGQTKEGGIEGVVDWQDGAFGQQVHARVAERWGKTPSTMPGYGGIATACFSGEGGDNYDGFYWTANTPFIPAVAFEVTRFSRGWQDGLRAVPEEGNGWILTEWDDIRRGVTGSDNPLVWDNGLITRDAGFERLVPRHALYRPPHRPVGKRNAEYEPAHELEPLGRRPSDRRGRAVHGCSRPLRCRLAPCGRDQLDQHQRPRSQHGSGIPEHAGPVLPVRDRVGRSLEHADHARQPEPGALQLHGRIHRMGASLARPGRPGRWRRRRRGSLGERPRHEPGAHHPRVPGRSDLGPRVPHVRD